MAKREVLFNCVIGEFDKLVFELRPDHPTSARGVYINDKMEKALVDYFKVVVSEDKKINSDIAYIRDKISELL